MSCRGLPYLELGAVLSSMFTILSMASELSLCNFALRKTLFFKRVHGEPHYVLRMEGGSIDWSGKQETPNGCQAQIQLEPGSGSRLDFPLVSHEEDNEVSLYFAYIRCIEPLHMVLQPGDGSVIACQIHEVEWMASPLRFP
ncbi:hypothetical protein GJ744_011426 [Endocarpon pusillum]|uniref:Uncharacterized protein n=1 Tax=Endocarpon pusillum TaxID=364733 RepID=A0A8H7E182_9EURO|nr:hypothetical protein GJ744_011426 [Endocarpon pusillum]